MELIEKSALYGREQVLSQWTCTGSVILDNPVLQAAFNTKREEMIKQGVSDDLLDVTYAFAVEQPALIALYRDDNLGPTHRLGLNNSLGDNSRGFRVWRHADVCLSMSDHRQQLQLVIYKVMLGRVKTVELSSHHSCPPSLGYDCHIPAEIASTEKPNSKNKLLSQIYLYDYLASGEPASFVRHCLPYAVLTFQRSTRNSPALLKNNPKSLEDIENHPFVVTVKHHEESHFPWLEEARKRLFNAETRLTLAELTLGFPENILPVRRSLNERFSLIKTDSCAEESKETFRRETSPKLALTRVCTVKQDEIVENKDQSDDSFRSVESSTSEQDIFSPLVVSSYNSIVQTVKNHSADRKDDVIYVKEERPSKIPKLSNRDSKHDHRNKARAHGASSKSKMGSKKAKVPSSRFDFVHRRKLVVVLKRLTAKEIQAWTRKVPQKVSRPPANKTKHCTTIKTYTDNRWKKQNKFYGEHLSKGVQSKSGSHQPFKETSKNVHPGKTTEKVLPKKKKTPIIATKPSGSCDLIGEILKDGGIGLKHQTGQEKSGFEKRMETQDSVQTGVLVIDLCDDETKSATTTQPKTTPKHSTGQSSSLGTPKHKTPQASTLQCTTPQRTTPQKTTSHHTTPQHSRVTPQRTTPQHSTVTPQRTTPQHSTVTPQRTTPQHSTVTPQHSTVAPQHSTVTPQHSTATPQQTTPQRTTPQHTAQQTTVTAPQHITPQKTTPLHTTPQHPSHPVQYSLGDGLLPTPTFSPRPPSPHLPLPATHHPLALISPPAHSVHRPPLALNPSVPSIPPLCPSLPPCVPTLLPLFPSIPPLCSSIPPSAPSIPPLALSKQPSATSIPPSGTSIPRLVRSKLPSAQSIPPLVSSIPSSATSIPPLVPSIPPSGTSIPRLVHSKQPSATSIPRLVPSIPPLCPSLPPCVPSIPPLFPSIPPLVHSKQPSATSISPPVTSISTPVTSISTPVTSISPPVTSIPKSSTSISKSATCVPKPATSIPKPATSISKSATSIPKSATSISTPVTSISPPVSTFSPALSRSSSTSTLASALSLSSLEKSDVTITSESRSDSKLKDRNTSKIPVATKVTSKTTTAVRRSGSDTKLYKSSPSNDEIDKLLDKTLKAARVEQALKPRDPRKRPPPKEMVRKNQSVPRVTEEKTNTGWVKELSKPECFGAFHGRTLLKGNHVKSRIIPLDPLYLQYPFKPSGKREVIPMDPRIKRKRRLYGQLDLPLPNFY